MSTDTQLAELLGRNADLFAAYEQWANGQIMLLAGTVDDPNSFDENGGKTGPLGYYPVVNVSGQTIYVPSIARLKALALGGANAAVLEGLIAQVAGVTDVIETGNAVIEAGLIAAQEAIAETERTAAAGNLALTRAAVADEAAHRADTMGDLRTFLARLGPESGIAGAHRWRVGHREYGRFDRFGFAFWKALLGKSVTVEDKPGIPISERLLSGPVGSFFRAGTVESTFGGGRIRLGNRLLMSLDAARGVYPRKLTVPTTATVDDNLSVPLVERLIGRNAGQYFKNKPGELGGFGHRWRIGNRLLATMDIARGFYPRKATLPANTRVDDDLTGSLSSRLVSAGVGIFFRRMAPELGGLLRLRAGNRMLVSVDPVRGLYPRRALLPADCKLTDQPTVGLADRLGGSGRAASASASWIAIAAADASGKTQISTRRRSDGKRFQITPGVTNYRNPVLTPDDRVIFDSDADGRLMYALVTGGPLWPVDPYDIIDCWGDSLTASAGATANEKRFPQALGLRLGSVASVNNRGVGGQVSADIAARQGGAPALITLAGNQIPATGGVQVTSYSTDLLFNSGNSGSLSLTGTLAGVPGTLSGNNVAGRGNATYTFTRTSAGSVTACPAGTPFIPDLGTATRSRVQIFTYGRNDGTNSTALNNILAALAASVAHQTAYAPRYLVGGTLASPGESLAGFNAVRDALAAAHPGRFVDLNAPPSVEEMAQINFVPDSYGAYSNGRTDAGDIAAGYIPSGMRAGATTGSGDFLHLNDFGYALWALRYYRAIVAMGWWPSLPTV